MKMSSRMHKAAHLHLIIISLEVRDSQSHLFSVQSGNS